MRGMGDLGLAKKGLGMDDSFLSMFLFFLLMLELVAAPAVACLDTDQTISWAKFMFLAIFSYAVFINLSS